MTEEPTTPDREEQGRRIIAAVNRRDFDAALAGFSKKALWDRSLVGLEVLERREAIRRTVFEDLRRGYDDFEEVLEEFHDLGNGVTFSVHHQRGRPEGSSRFLEQRFALILIWAEDGLVQRGTPYTDVDEACTAAERLAEEPR
jgi:ketosteroid isomerase-like protein